MRPVSLLEYETATIAERPGEAYLTYKEVAGLEQAQRAMGVQAFSWTSRDRIRTAQYVGIVASDGVRLEILPKIDGLDGGGTRASLMRMLCAAIDIDVSDGELTGHAVQDKDLLELLIGLFAQRLAEQLRRGLVRDYRREEADLAVLRGKLDVNAQFRRLAATPNRLACVYDEFTADTPLNRMLLVAVTALRRRSILSRNQRLLNEISAHFEDVSSIDPASALKAPIVWDRRMEGWRQTERIARLLLQAMFQTAHGGAHSGVALLFDMNDLFERYVTSVARACLTPLGFRFSAQGPRLSLAKEVESGRPAFMTKPDIHLERGDEVIVLDTKWKRIDPTIPNSAVAQADAYQMHGYANIYDASSTVLLYPFMREVMRQPGLQAEWIYTGRNSSLKVVSVDVGSRHATERDLLAAVAAVPDTG